MVILNTTKLIISFIINTTKLIISKSKDCFRTSVKEKRRERISSSLFKFRQPVKFAAYSL